MRRRFLRGHLIDWLRRRFRCRRRGHRLSEHREGWLRLVCADGTFLGWYIPCDVCRYCVFRVPGAEVP